MAKVYCKEMMLSEERRTVNGSGGRPQVNTVIQDEIVRLYKLGKLTVKQIAEGVGVSEATVYRTLNRRTEKGVSE